MMLVTGETSQPARILRPRGRAHLFFWVIPIRSPAHLLEIPSPPTSPPMKTLAVLQLSSPPQGFAGVVACLGMTGPAQTRQGTSMDNMSIGMLTTSGISSVTSSRVVQDDTTRSIFMDTLTTSIGRVVLSGLDWGISPVGPAIEDVTGQE